MHRIVPTSPDAKSAAVRELDTIRIELGRVGIHFALFTPRISREERSDYRKLLKSYGESIDRLQEFIHRLQETRR
jgi:hypothetical protein